MIKQIIETRDMEVQKQLNEWCEKILKPYQDDLNKHVIPDYNPSTIKEKKLHITCGGSQEIDTSSGAAVLDPSEETKFAFSQSAIKNSIIIRRTLPASQVHHMYTFEQFHALLVPTAIEMIEILKLTKGYPPTEWSYGRCYGKFRTPTDNWLYKFEDKPDYEIRLFSDCTKVEFERFYHKLDKILDN